MFFFLLKSKYLPFHSAAGILSKFLLVILYTVQLNDSTFLFIVIHGSVDSSPMEINIYVSMYCLLCQQIPSDILSVNYVIPFLVHN